MHLEFGHVTIRQISETDRNPTPPHASINPFWNQGLVIIQINNPLSYQSKTKNKKRINNPLEGHSVKLGRARPETDNPTWKSEWIGLVGYTSWQ